MNRRWEIVQLLIALAAVGLIALAVWNLPRIGA